MVAEIIICIVFYIIGAAYAAGRTGGVRDGADGIGDMIFIIGWPVMFIGWLIYLPLSAIYKLGVSDEEKSRTD